MTSAPLLPRDVDLRDFTFMPIDIVRLFGSDFHAKSTDAEWRAGMTLWLKSFHQVPAASIPDSDIALARLAEFGRDTVGWQQVKEGALHGWVLCSDERFYHPVVAEKALEGWIGKLLRRRSGAVGNAKRWGTPADLVDIDRQLAEAGDALQKLAPGSPILRKCRPHTADQSPSDTVDGGSGSDPTSVAKGSQADPKTIGPRSHPDRGQIAEGSQGKTKTKTKTREGGTRASAREDPPTADASEPVKPRKRGRQLSQETLWPDNLAIGQADRDFAAKHGFTGAAGERLFEKFEAKAKAKGWTYKDWHAAFRTFVLNEHPPPPRPNGSQAWRPPDV